MRLHRKKKHIRTRETPAALERANGEKRGKKKKKMARAKKRMGEDKLFE